MSINPEILRWARESIGLSQDDVARVIGKPVEIVIEWEAGQRVPTYVQLETLAYRVYKRPVALFFFPAPPEEKDIRREFRLLPEGEGEDLDPDTIFAIREAKARQDGLAEIAVGRNDTWKTFSAFKRQDLRGIDRFSQQVREYFDVSVEQQKSWGSEARALKEWRRLVEDVGVYVFKRSFKQKNVSGFCIYDDEWPLIYINNSTSSTRQIFTLFHELAHILLSESDVTIEGFDYREKLKGRRRSVEIACNRFASSFLVPPEDFSNQLHQLEDPLEEIEYLASRYRVSREVILRSFLERNMVTSNQYSALVEKWAKSAQLAKKPKKGGNYYSTQASYLSPTYARLAFSRFYQGDVSLGQLSEYLSVKAKSIPGIERAVMGG